MEALPDEIWIIILGEIKWDEKPINHIVCKHWYGVVREIVQRERKYLSIHKILFKNSIKAIPIAYKFKNSRQYKELLALAPRVKVKFGLFSKKQLGKRTNTVRKVIECHQVIEYKPI